jgi:CBS domain-containing protein
MQRKSDAAARPVSEVMQSEVATLRVNDRLDLADDVMKLGRVRHLPVLPVVQPDRSLIGLVTETELVRAALLSDSEPKPEARRAGTP